MLKLNEGLCVPQIDEKPLAQVSGEGDSHGVYYQSDFTRCSFYELFRWTNPSLVKFLIVALRKCFGVPMRANIVLIRNANQFIDFDELPPHVVSELLPAWSEAKSLGFEQSLAQIVPMFGDCETYSVIFSNSTGTIISHFTYSRVRSLLVTGIALLSHLDNGTILATTNHKKGLLPPPESKGVYRPGLGFEALLAIHEKRIASLTYEQPLRFDLNGLRQIVLKTALRVFDFNVDRGVFVPVTDEEVNKIKAQTQSLNSNK